MKRKRQWQRQQRKGRTKKKQDNLSVCERLRERVAAITSY